MTLQEAINTGKPFQLGSVKWNSYTEFIGCAPTTEMLFSNNFAVVDVGVTIKYSTTLEDAFKTAWEAARVGSTSIKPAGESTFYSKLLNELKALGEVDETTDVNFGDSDDIPF